MTSIVNDVDIINTMLDLMLGNRIPFGNILPFLFFSLDLYLRDESLRLELAFVCRLYAKALVIEGFPKEFLSLLTPDLFPFTLKDGQITYCVL